MTFKKLVNHQISIYLVVLILFCNYSVVFSRENNDPKIAQLNKTRNNILSLDDDLVTEYAVHNKGNIALVVTNTGMFGTYGSAAMDPLTGKIIVSCIYPKNSNLVYLWVGALWIGAVVGRDTLVSTGTEDYYQTTEYWPTEYWHSGQENQYRRGGFEYKSIDESSMFYSDDAFSEQDIYCEYDDTRDDNNLVGRDPTDGRPHIPLNIKISQRSMAWSYEYADDFILFDYKIENVGFKELKDVFMSIYVDGDVWHETNNGPAGWRDDIVGFLKEYPSPDCIGFSENINLAYTADNDGDPKGDRWDHKSVRSIIGARVIRTPSDSLNYSFNWWITLYGDPSADFGPRMKGTEERPFRDMNGSLGTPLGDKNKYYVMSHEEFDYDLFFSAIDHSDSGFLPPAENAYQLAQGYDTRLLLSFGPFDISPGEKLPITFAWVAGENFHVNADDYLSHDPLQPWIYYNMLNFDEVAKNSRWASWVYDNPGVDTDGDGYYGKYCINCIDTALTFIYEIDTVANDSVIIDTLFDYSKCDTIYYEGDGIPDFRGASPPPAPTFWLEPDVGKIKVRFNGLASEIFRDQFSREIDFEGYRIYIARDDRSSSYTQIVSYDLEDYNKFVYNIDKLPNPGYELYETPFTLEELRCLYGSGISQEERCNDSTFNPWVYTISTPYIHPIYTDSVFYFTSQDYNTSELGMNTEIIKKYPNQPYPSTLDPDSANADELTEDGYLKYFEYEYQIIDLLPTVPYYVNVTAFDYGSPKSGLPSLETPIYNGAKMAYAFSTPDEVESKNLDAYVYPNPYRVDAGYKEQGYENRNEALADERARRIHFVNLPAVCKISIYSIDGDLVREIDHNFPMGGPIASHDTWDLITRNTQMVTSGLYYWIVESEGRTQMGKLVIIM